MKNIFPTILLVLFCVLITGAVFWGYQNQDNTPGISNSEVSSSNPIR